ncbi:MAG: helix-turn-helix transcriptional regulator [Candidatus Omnitrophica bacterium]|nr:helix-turn-helix transcriptional regulator [Candidatus Omnitrophota bacterium]
MKERTKKDSIQRQMPEEFKENLRDSKPHLNLGVTIRALRQAKGLSGIELCRKAKGLDPRTLTAIEKGRIRNPSIRILQVISEGLRLPLGRLFYEAEMQAPHFLYQGTQKGFCQMDFHKMGIKIISFTPFVKDFFCGKVILGPKRKMDGSFLDHHYPFHISVLVGRVEVEIEEKKILLREGESLFFHGMLKHNWVNPRYREAVLSLVTAPSFL